MSDPKGHTIQVVSGPAGPSLYLDDYRIAGPKPWGGGTVLYEFAFKDKDLEAAGVTLDPRPPAGHYVIEWDERTRAIIATERISPDEFGASSIIASNVDPAWGPDLANRAGVTLDPRPAPDAALDVERLAEAIDTHRREWPQIEYHRVTAMTEPRTEAGRELLDVLAQPWVRGMVGYESMIEGYLPRVLAIERESWLQGHDEAVRLQAEYDADTRPHEWTTAPNHSYEWCSRCLLVRQANGSTDKKPCKGPVKVTVR